MHHGRVKAFTLIEILVAISILAVLSLIGFFAYSQVFKSSRDTKRQSDLKFMQSAFEQFHADNFRYPNNSEVQEGMPLTLNNKTYLGQVPQDPKITPAYKYEALNCTSGTNCQNYCLYAKLENSNNATIPSICTSAGSTYNYAVTKP